MARANSTKYNLAKISLLPLHQPGLFSKAVPERSDLLAQILLSNPKLGEPGAPTLGVFEAQRTPDDQDVITGFVARSSDAEVTHVEGSDLVIDHVPDYPHARFFVDLPTRSSAFQSSNITRGFDAFLRDFDGLLSHTLAEFNLYSRTVPRSDPERFRDALLQAELVFAIRYKMIPPNGYTNKRILDFMTYASEAVETNEVEIGLEARRGQTLHPSAPIVGDMIDECVAGNGEGTANILDKDGQKRTIRTKGARIVRELAGLGKDLIRALLK